MLTIVLDHGLAQLDCVVASSDATTPTTTVEQLTQHLFIG